MPKKLRINGSFRNGTTVYSNILTVLATTILVYNLWKTFLSHATLSGNQYRQVRRCHLHGYIYTTHQGFIVSNNAKAQLDLLYFCLYHIIRLLLLYPTSICHYHHVSHNTVCEEDWNGPVSHADGYGIRQ